MAAMAQAAVDGCAKQNVKLLVYCTLRSLQEQARLYRQSRTRKDIDTKMAQLRKAKFGFLADIIESVGAQYGRWATNAGPGESWHNYAEAFDAVPLRGKVGLWNEKLYKHEWNVYGSVVSELGLEWGGNWKRKDMPHSQLREGANPLDIYSPKQVREMLTKNGLL